ncbi:hypothetical protein SAMN05216227_10644 [Pseudorhodobacter antarcticus]|uniref:Uncharacterized protein n=1 Tax=Pseudorhodobacter antarcticus TaxID=1077947 RepID=A0A1H8MXR0_9RHOB|nr:hypothetical protein SAMN05216227_10644 [Pseudorhodobacter antarcticus]
MKYNNLRPRRRLFWLEKPVNEYGSTQMALEADKPTFGPISYVVYHFVDIALLKSVALRNSPTIFAKPINQIVEPPQIKGHNGAHSGWCITTPTPLIDSYQSSAAGEKLGQISPNNHIEINEQSPSA